MKNYFIQIYGYNIVRFSLRRWQVRDRSLFQYSVRSTVFADLGLWTAQGAQALFQSVCTCTF
jgi:hypothetical protein